MKSGVQVGSYLFPWDRLDLAGLKLTYSPLDLFGPGHLYAGVGFPFETLQKKSGQFSAFMLC